MAEFFPRRADGPGLALFLNAGDPPLDQLTDVALMLDESGVDCLELAVPFPDSVTDGPVIRRSAARALARGTGLDDVLSFVSGVRGRLRNLRIVLLADWSYTVRPLREPAFLLKVADSGADALLVHALPPVLRTDYLKAAERAAVPVVTTCYANSRDEVIGDAALATAYTYLVATYGRSGTVAAHGYAGLSDVVSRLRARASAPIAVGFGVRSAADLAAVAATGADAAVVGSAAVARLEQATAQQRDVTDTLSRFIGELRSDSTSTR
ncbi:tryptophan synthase subunit alpha [Couchioplanes azureus]|uniref:tryptophan synthase subunit alpha n=1 Tax=Couchioplanes caeruleus TaxID=56438 RepID=UPI00166FC7FB|nr:tryptophan synthase subunit alpha [Couchioplanes caeruleus]GGQ86163.1 tryptophan synthase alpha chain [Couchioplanes caeruleus subsp. azureus]